jgi:hypothetical protein
MFIDAIFNSMGEKKKGRKGVLRGMNGDGMLAKGNQCNETSRKIMSTDSQGQSAKA